MHRRKPPAVKEDISPNLIPMIDIMFLLLLFFMLGADMGKREFEDVVLPLADKIKEDDNIVDKASPITTVNIHHDPNVACPIHANGGICREEGHWLWAVRGKDYNKDTIRPQLQLEAEEVLEDTVDPQAGKRLSKRKVLIRADRTAPYGDIQKLIELCGLASIYKIEVGAAKPPTGGT